MPSCVCPPGPWGHPFAGASAGVAAPLASLLPEGVGGATATRLSLLSPIATAGRAWGGDEGDLGQRADTALLQKAEGPSCGGLSRAGRRCAWF